MTKRAADVMMYELWNLETGNAVGEYPSEAAALEAVRLSIEAHGIQYAEQLGLGVENRRGRTRKIATRRELVERALASAPRSVPA
jgi:hypothetical protein